MPLPLALLALPALAKAGVGLYQNIKGKQRAKNLQRPERSTPQATLEATARARYGAQGGQRPGSAVARESIRGGQAGAVSQVSKAGGSAASTMAAALGAQQQANKSMQQQDVLDAQFQQQMQTQYLNQLQNLSREQAANWQWNEAQQFQEEASAAQRLQQSGMQNLFGGMGEAAGLGFMSKMGYLGEGMGEGGFLSNIFGGKRKQAEAERDQAVQYLQQGQPQIPQINMPQIPQMNFRTPLNPIPQYGAGG